MVEFIWKERNSILHGGIPSSPDSLYRSLSVAASSYSSALCNERDSATAPVRWLQPPPPWVKINMDAAVRVEASIAAAVARNEQGSVLGRKTKEFPYPNPLVAEALALLHGLEFAVANEWKFVVLESDCMEELRSWNDDQVAPTCIISVLQLAPIFLMLLSISFLAAVISSRTMLQLGLPPEGVALEIAEAVLGALKGELSSTAVNAPMVPAEVLSELAPFVSLAEKLGTFVVQLVAGGSGIKSIKVTYASARSPDDLDTRLLRAMVTKGLIEPISSVSINLVNSDFIAKQRGLRITEDRIILDGSPENPVEFIQVQIANVESKFATAISDSGEIKVEGRVKDGKPHLTKLGSFEVDVSLEGSVILCRQFDQPGLIGKVGSILGEENVNVSFMTVGRIAPRKQAVMTIGVDEEPGREALKKISEIAAIEEFVFLKL
ncbi:Allosteric substrate binding domain containing protein [Parasponia andersonii]|uniref:phosphoglycerate dehydrogenase n=1 Tax=Parasponia andersonii TaxID=3476 RepID=A0A2P5BJ93_PARAD|nr:Allosteric substrate binding domain containing protein [Parasponia andersonii]